MNPESLMQAGNMHFWGMWIAIILTVIFIAGPIVLGLRRVIKETEKDEPDWNSFPKYRYPIMLGIGIILTTALWTAWGSGNKLAVTPKEEEGAFQQIMAAPDQPTEEVKEIQEEDWKSTSQKAMEKKLEEQEDPDEVMRRAMERALNTKKKQE